MDFLLILLVLLVVVAIVAGPLRRGLGTSTSPSEQARRSDLEAAREAKLAEIRDAELDRRTGKLSDEDFSALNQQLRAEAVAIMRALQDLGEPAPDR